MNNEELEAKLIEILNDRLRVEVSISLARVYYDSNSITTTVSLGDVVISKTVNHLDTLPGQDKGGW